jgi:hypothetical protein
MRVKAVRKTTKKRQKKAAPPIPPVFLDFSTIHKMKKTFVQIINDFHAGRIKDHKFRTLAYSIQTLTGIFRLEIDNEVSKRLDALEQRIRDFNPDEFTGPQLVTKGE